MTYSMIWFLLLGSLLTRYLMPSLKSPNLLYLYSQSHLIRTLTFLALNSSSRLMGNFSRLTTDLLIEIITRLPTESVLECKLVCKQWRNLVSRYPSFSQIHLSRLNQSADSSKLSFLVSDEGKHFYYFEYNEKSDEIRRIKFPPPMESSSYTLFGYNLFGSINGLVCFSRFSDLSVCICNPVTKELVKLPKYNKRSSLGGFGYLPFTNEYKVVKLFYETPASGRYVEVAVYTVGSGNGWRNVGRFDLESAVLLQGGVFVNGALYWADICLRKTLFVFDLTEEKFYEYISSPPLKPGRDWSSDYIGVLGRVLYYAHRFGFQRDDTCSEIWLLKGRIGIDDKKDQVEQETMGWRKGFDLCKEKPFSFTKNGSVLYFYNGSVGIYDVGTSTSKELVRFGAVKQIVSHMNTLVSLRELGEEDIEIMDSAKLMKARKPFLPTN